MLVKHRLQRWDSRKAMGGRSWASHPGVWTCSESNRAHRIHWVGNPVISLYLEGECLWEGANYIYSLLQHRVGVEQTKARTKGMLMTVRRGRSQRQWQSTLWVFDLIKCQSLLFQRSYIILNPVSAVHWMQRWSKVSVEISGLSYEEDMMPLIEILIPGEGICYKKRMSEGLGKTLSLYTHSFWELLGIHKWR